MASLVWRSDRKKWYAYFELGEGKHTGKPLNNVPRRKRLSRQERDLAEEVAQEVAEEHRLRAADTLDLELAADIFLGELKVSAAAGTFELYRTVMRALLVCLGSDLPLRDVLPIHIRRFRDERLQTHAATTVITALRCVAAFFSWWQKQRDDAGARVLLENPASEVAKPRKPKTQKHFPTDDEIRSMLDDLQKARPRELYALGLFGALAGLRIGEIVGLETEHVDLQARTMRVWGKSKHPRVIPMHSMVYQFLMDWPLDGQYVFPSPDPSRPIRRWSTILGKKFNPWLKANGFPFTHRLLRHFFNDSLHKCAGLPTFARLLVVGHEDEATNRIYSNPHVEQARPFVEQLLQSPEDSAPAQ